jgi:hypothetical protein
MLFLQSVERRGELLEVKSGGEHAQRMTGRRGVDDDQRISVLLGQLAHPHPGHDLVHSRKGELEEAAKLFTIEIRAAVSDLEEFVEVGFQEMRVKLFGVEFFDRKVAGLPGCWVAG